MVFDNDKVPLLLRPEIPRKVERTPPCADITLRHPDIHEQITDGRKEPIHMLPTRRFRTKALVFHTTTVLIFRLRRPLIPEISHRTRKIVVAGDFPKYPVTYHDPAPIRTIGTALPDD